MSEKADERYTALEVAQARHGGFIVISRIENRVDVLKCTSDLAEALGFVEGHLAVDEGVQPKVGMEHLGRYKVYSGHENLSIAEGDA